MCQSDEYVILLQPVLVRRSDVQSLPIMPKPQMQEVQPVPLQEFISSPFPSSSDDTRQKPRKGRASEKQMRFVMTLMQRLNMTEQEACQAVGIDNLDQMTKSQATAFIDKYKNAPPQF